MRRTEISTVMIYKQHGRDRSERGLLAVRRLVLVVRTVEVEVSARPINNLLVNIRPPGAPVFRGAVCRSLCPGSPGE